jgi:hypothetical protein
MAEMPDILPTLLSPVACRLKRLRRSRVSADNNKRTRRAHIPRWSAPILLIGGTRPRARLCLLVAFHKDAKRPRRCFAELRRQLVIRRA